MFCCITFVIACAKYIDRVKLNWNVRAKKKKNTRFFVVEFWKSAKRKGWPRANARRVREKRETDTNNNSNKTKAEPQKAKRSTWDKLLWFAEWINHDREYMPRVRERFSLATPFWSETLSQMLTPIYCISLTLRIIFSFAVTHSFSLLYRCFFLLFLLLLVPSKRTLQAPITW